MIKTFVTATVLTIGLSACAAYKTEAPEVTRTTTTTTTTGNVLVDGNNYYESAPNTKVVVQKETYAPNGDKIIVRDHYEGTDQVIFNEDYPYHAKLIYSQGR